MVMILGDNSWWLDGLLGVGTVRGWKRGVMFLPCCWNAMQGNILR